MAESKTDRKKPHRVNVNFSESAFADLKRLAEERGQTMSEVLRDAIVLEKWFMEAHDRGERVCLERDGHVHEVVLR